MSSIFLLENGQHEKILVKIVRKMEELYYLVRLKEIILKILMFMSKKRRKNCEK